MPQAPRKLPKKKTKQSALATGDVELPKSETNRTQGKVNFTTDDVQTYYDVKLVGGMTPDEAARVTGVKFGLAVTVNPAGDLILPDDIPAKEYAPQFDDELPPDDDDGGNGKGGATKDGKAQAPRRSEPSDKKSGGATKQSPGKDIKDIPPDEEPEPAASTKDTPESVDPVTAFIMENPEFNTAHFTAYCAGHPEADVTTLAEHWWAERFAKLPKPCGVVPAFPDLFTDAQHAITRAGIREGAEATALTIAEYKRLGGIFLSEAKWASTAFKNPGFWKKNAPFGHRDKPFTDPSIPMSAIMQTARKHPGKERGVLGFTQAVLNLKQAKPETAARLEKIKSGLQQTLARNADRRDTAVKRVKQQFA